ncbi:MAG: sugar phosphate isomerase/epimerase family protein [Gemmatimonadales bacterium]|jgi:sugar phosphate isomerase/epimerase
MDRRRFVARAAGALAGLGVAGCAGRTASAESGDVRSPAAGRDGSSTGVAPLYTISLAQWSLHRALRGGELDALEFPAVARERFGIDAVEYVNQFFMDRASDARYIGDLRRRADDAGVRSLLIMCDGLGRLGDPDPAARAGAIENHYPWVEAAATLGCHSIRVNAESEGTREEAAAFTADGLARLTDYAVSRGLNVIVENHGGLSCDGSWLADVMRRVGDPHCGTLPDFGNFDLGDGRQYDRYRGVAEMMPFARAVSAKSYDFDEAGEETTIDYHRMLRIVVDAGYHGHLGIEYEGDRLSEPDGIEATRRLLERVRADLETELR